MLHPKAKPNRDHRTSASGRCPASSGTLRRLRHTGRIVAASALCAVVIVPCATAETQTIETDHFIIAYESERDSELAPVCTETAERAYAELGEAFGYYPGGKVQIAFLPEEPPQEQAKGRTGRAKATENGGLISLVSPRVFGFAETVRTGIYHEYWHIVAHHLTEGRIPRWLDEGCAILIARQLSPGYGEYLKEALGSGDLMSFKELERFFSSPEEIDLAPAYLAYAECCTVIEHFQDVYGQDKLKALLQELKEKDLETAFERVTENSLAEFEESWKRSLDKGVWGASYLGNRAFSRVRAKPLGAVSHRELSIKSLAENRERVKVTGLSGYNIFVEAPRGDQQGRSFLTVNEKRIAVHPPLFGEGMVLIEETRDGLLLTMPDGTRTHLDVHRRIGF